MIISGSMAYSIGTKILRAPAIVINGVIVGNSCGTGKQLVYPALIDTGASRTIIPIGKIHEIGIVPHDIKRLQLANGTITKCYIVRAQIQMPGIGYMNTNVFAMNRQYVLIGMDILMHLYIIVDGKAAKWVMGPSMMSVAL
jgi:predicted aspartyl protease